MDAIFRALVDPSRRLLLDRLRADDGQTLTELCGHLPGMTRFGVMKHLRILEEAGLVTTLRLGRHKHHYLNAAAIRLVHDRWISRYTEPLARTLAGLKAELEGGSMKPVHVYQTYIRCDPSAAWRAITDGDHTVAYFYGTRVESEWSEGSTVRYLAPDGGVVADGTVIAVDAPTRLEMTFHAHWDPQLEAEGPARMVWLVEEQNGLTRLTVEYYDLAEGGYALRDFREGLPLIVAGMKTLLETGKPLAA